MAQNHVRKGATMPWTNATPAAVAAGDVVPVGALHGIALGDIAIGATGELAIEEVWDLPKEANAFAQGEQVYYDPVTAQVDNNNANLPIGKAFEAALLADTTVAVKINV